MRIGVTGHQDIPPGALDYVVRGIDTALDEWLADLVGVSSLAAGADQIFAASVLKRGGRLDVVLPCRQYRKTFSRLQDVKNFEALLARASTVERLEFDEPSNEAYRAAGRRVVESSELVLAIWDGQPARGAGGTADIVNYAESLGRPLKIVWPDGVGR